MGSRHGDWNVVTETQHEFGRRNRSCRRVNSRRMGATEARGVEYLLRRAVQFHAPLSCRDLAAMNRDLYPLPT